MLGRVEQLLEVAKDAPAASLQQTSVECKGQIDELREKMEEETVAISSKIQMLKSSTASLAADYHWVVLILVYGLIFYLGAS